jgi:hypothetical protein
MAAGTHGNQPPMPVFRIDLTWRGFYEKVPVRYRPVETDIGPSDHTKKTHGNQ